MESRFKLGEKKEEQDEGMAQCSAPHASLQALTPDVDKKILDGRGEKQNDGDEDSSQRGRQMNSPSPLPSSSSSSMSAIPLPSPPRGEEVISDNHEENPQWVISRRASGLCSLVDRGTSRFSSSSHSPSNTTATAITTSFSACSSPFLSYSGSGLRRHRVGWNERVEEVADDVGLEEEEEGEDSLIELTPALRALLQIRERPRRADRSDTYEYFDGEAMEDALVHDDDDDDDNDDDHYYDNDDEDDEEEEEEEGEEYDEDTDSYDDEEEEEDDEEEEEEEEEERNESAGGKKETDNVHGIFLFAHHHSCRTYFIITILHPTNPSQDFSFFVTDWAAPYAGKGWGPRELLKESWLRRLGFLGEKDKTLRVMVELIGNVF